MKLGCQGDTEDVAATTVQWLFHSSVHGAPQLHGTSKESNPPEKLQATGSGLETECRQQAAVAGYNGQKQESMEAESPTYQCPPGFSFSHRGATEERLKLPSRTNFTKLPVEWKSVSRPVPRPLVPKLEDWRKKLLSSLLLLPQRVSITGSRARELRFPSSRTTKRPAFRPARGGTNARLGFEFGTVRSSGVVC